MTTHYEWLEVTPSASVSEIEAAYEARLDHYRRLINHHEPDRRREAQEALDALDAARAVLSESGPRAAYDAALGLAGVIDGVADPSLAYPSTPVASLPPPPARAARSPSNPWECPECGFENPPGTKFCLQEGRPLVRECPECRHMASMVVTGICGECGANYPETSLRGQAEEVQQPTRRFSEAETSKGDAWLARTDQLFGGRRDSAVLGFRMAGDHDFIYRTLGEAVRRHFGVDERNGLTRSADGYCVRLHGPMEPELEVLVQPDTVAHTGVFLRCHGGWGRQSYRQAVIENFLAGLPAALIVEKVG